MIIRDRWGINQREEGNSVFAKQTPVVDRVK
jgi:bisphosphoglycerate-independent phosphoglycerate mutase (AlkP superfamily)